jgi:hypothetical protein
MRTRPNSKRQATTYVILNDVDMISLRNCLSKELATADNFQPTFEHNILSHSNFAS